MEESTTENAEGTVRGFYSHCGLDNFRSYRYNHVQICALFDRKNALNDGPVIVIDSY